MANLPMSKQDWKLCHQFLRRLKKRLGEAERRLEMLRSLYAHPAVLQAGSKTDKSSSE